MFRYPPWLARAGAFLLVAAVAVLGYRAYGAAGLGLAAAGIVMWFLLHWTRVMRVLQRAASQPVGSVASAVMLHAKLQPGLTLLQVVAMTGSLGQCTSAAEAPIEQYRWTDGAQSHVTCDFRDGKVQHWALVRPVLPDEAPGVPIASVAT